MHDVCGRGGCVYFSRVSQPRALPAPCGRLPVKLQKWPIAAANEVANGHVKSGTRRPLLLLLAYVAAAGSTITIRFIVYRGCSLSLSPSLYQRR